MMSISPPEGHGPAWLRVQKAGQVAQPAGMCARSRTNIASSYALCEEMRTLSRPRAVELTMDQSSARMMNLSPSTKKNKMSVDPNDSNSEGLGDPEERKRERKIRTARQIVAYCFFLAHIVDAAMGRVVLSLPVPALEEVGADPLVLEIEDIRAGELSERE